jgi:predicted glutamine amidotransferase
MCRFVLYLGESIPLANLITRPHNSLIHQSFEAEYRDPLNGDGFGVAWYVANHEEPAVFKAITPAWNNRNLIHLARVTRSQCVMAHVRAASPGLAVTETNCHPFTVGRFSFMHNGMLAGFHRIRRALLTKLSDDAFHAVEGSTDSELLFGLFLDAYRSSKEADPLDAMGDALASTVDQLLRVLRDHHIATPSHLNLAVSDGERAAATRYTTGDTAKAPTLYWHEGRRYVCGEDGKVCMIDPDVRSDTVIVASEPLSEDFGWEPLAPNTMLLVREHRRVQFRPLPPPSAATSLRTASATSAGR